MIYEKTLPYYNSEKENGKEVTRKSRARNFQSTVFVSEVCRECQKSSIAEQIKMK